MKQNYLKIFTSAVVAFLLVNINAQAGSVWRVIFDQDDGSSPSSLPAAYRDAVDTLTNSAYFPFGPDYGEQLDDFRSASSTTPVVPGLQGKDNSGQDYGSQIQGYLEAPATGNYVFSIASADNSALWLTTNNASPFASSNAVLIAYEPGSGEVIFSGNRLDTRDSAPIWLIQGQKYYFQVLHQHGAGNGYIQVGWQRPDGVQEIIPALHLAQYEDNFYTYVSLWGQPPSFNAPGGGLPGGYLGGNLTNKVVLNEGSELLLPLDVLAQQPTAFTWTTNGVVVPGQNLSYFDIQHVPATYNGLKIQAIVTNSFGSLTSAVATVTIIPDTTPPAISTVDTAGNPNLVEVIYSKVVSPVTATNLANYAITNLAGGTLVITNATLSADQLTVYLAGNFNFSTASNYLLTVRNVKDQTVVGNLLSPNPSTVAFTLTAPLGTTYHFDNGLPSDIRLFGNARLETNSSVYPPSGGSYLALTDATRSQNGAVLLTTRHDVDQVHITFKTRISDSGASVITDQPWGDGFSVNIAPVLPLNTFSSPQFGYSPVTPGSQLSIYFNAHANSTTQPAEIGVSLNNNPLTNILAGVGGLPTNGIPSIVSTDGHWAPVDINIHRDGTLYLAFDGVVLLTNYPTPWVGISSAEVNFGAATRSWYETHWIDDLYINFGEGDVGNVGLSANSVLGGTFFENATVNLIAVPTGAGPFTYQWYKNGVPITGANGRILTFTGTLGSGGSFYLAVSNAFSGVISSTNLVVIQPDLKPVVVTAVRGVAGGVNQVQLTFSKPLDPATATALSTYSSAYFVVNAAKLSADGLSVTLNTTQQRVGANYPLAITGLKDTTAAANLLNTNLSFVSTLSYPDEILADNPARYFKLDETNGTVAFTQTAIADSLNTNGTYNNLPILGVPPLVPSAGSNEFAVRFVAANTNWILVPNGGDINDYRGPWAKKSWELWFNAASFPNGVQPGDTAVQAQTHSVAGLWEEGGNQRDATIYLWNSNNIPNPPTAWLTLHAYNSTPDGPGAPFGLLNFPATYVTYQVTTNVTYHVVGVLDGDANGTNGGLKLYVNGQLVAHLDHGVGQLYNHNGDVEIGQGNARSHLNASGVFGAFDGTIDEVSTYNTVLSSNRILAHYNAGLGLTTVQSVPPTVVTAVDPRGNLNRLNVIFNQPVSPASATNLANYSLLTSGNSPLPILSAQLGSDLKTVSLNGNFNFVVGNSYRVSVSGVADILAATNVVAPTTLAFTFASAGAVGIASAPTSQVLTENQTAAFSVTASGQTPYTYQWRTNGVAWGGQTNSTLSFTAAWNSGGNYSVVVSNEFSAITSSPAATLTILPDTQPLQLASVRGLAGSLNQIVLNFNKPVDHATATNLATYAIPTAGTTGLSLLGATLAANGQGITLATSAQIAGQTNQIAIFNLKDTAHVPNLLSVTAQFVSGISYRDEVLAESPVRYWTFDETNTSTLNTLVSKYDTDPLSLQGTINLAEGANAVTLGVPGLIPNIPNDRAFDFNSGATTNGSVDLPNGKDLTAILGPWSKITHIFSFRADRLPRINGSYTEAPGIYGHTAVAFYLYGTQDTNTPSQALLVFKANNTSSDGPGAPWGGNTPATAKYISYPIVAGQVYNVVGVVDGNASFTGQLRLYVNGVRVGTATGIGEIYKHPNNPPAFGHAFLTTVYGTNYTIEPQVSGTWADPFHGAIDEFAVLTSTLTDSRIAQLYAFSQTNPPNSSFVLVTNNVVAAAPAIHFTTGSSGAFQLSWPASATGYYLEFTTNLASGIWISNPATPATLNGTNLITQTVSNTGNKFFRLHHP